MSQTAYKILTCPVRNPVGPPCMWLKQANVWFCGLVVLWFIFYDTFPVLWQPDVICTGFVERATTQSQPSAPFLQLRTLQYSAKGED